VILDSPAGSHEGGIVAAPVFSRVMQQVLAFLNVPHDVELQNEDKRRLLLRAQAKEEDLSESSPDHLAEESTPADLSPAPATNGHGAQAPSPVNPGIVAQAPAPQEAAPRGTVVMNTGGSVVVPDFHGMSLRAALEEAEAEGIELEVSGSGMGCEQ